MNVATVTPYAVPVEPAPLEYPTDWSPAYTPEDQDDVRRVIDWINAGAGARSQAKLCRAVGLAQGTGSQLLAGKYPSPPRKHVARMLDHVERETARLGGVEVPIVRTSVTDLVEFVCKRAHQYRDVGIVSGEVGVGKTQALRRHAEHHPGVLLVEGFPEMNALVFLRQLVEMTSATVEKAKRDSRGTKADMLAGVIRALKGTDRLLVIDEADKITDQTLEYARRISDIAEIGLVLVGTERLRPMVESPLGKHGQISSRVGFWPAVIKSIKPEDAARIVRAAFAGQEQAPGEEVLEAFWQMCDGRARVLSKLIRNVVELCLAQGHALTPELVYAAGQQLMGLRRPAKGV